MDIKDCIYPDCQIKGYTAFTTCEHSCEHEQYMKRPKPSHRECTAAVVIGASCQFPRCDC